VPDLSEATIADLNVDGTVAIQGSRPEQDETPYAAVVAVLRNPDGQRKALRGKLTAVDGDTLWIRLRSGDEVELLTDANTQFFVRGVEEPTVAELSVGDNIGAQFIEREDGSLYASAVGTGSVRRQPRHGALRGRLNPVPPSL
jgi:hypothetical protein